MANHSIDSNFEGIIKAFNTVREDVGFKTKYYPSSYEGVVEAILELGRNLSGALPSPYPPNWEPILDEDGNPISGNFPPGYVPPQGDLWFDTRQGRLMVFVDDAYYQTNGADVLTRVQTEAPELEVIGGMWYDPNADALYLWEGTQWRLVSADTVNTATLALANPTAFRNIDTASLLPDTSGLSTQSDFNTWAVAAFRALEANAESNTTVYASDSSPIDQNEGDLWFNTDVLQLFVAHDSSWIPASTPSTPLTEDPNFNTLEAVVNGLQTNVNVRFSTTDSRLTALETEEHQVYDLEIDNSPLGIKLVDQGGLKTNVEITGKNGVSVTNDYGKLCFDGSQLSNRITAVENNYLTSVDKQSLENTAAQLQQQITAVNAKETVSPAELSELSNQVQALPTFVAVDSKLPLSGGQLSGELNLDNNKIRALGAPIDPTDAARLADITNALITVSNQYIPKNNPVFNGIDVERNDIALSGIKFVNGAASGIRAIELGTNTQTNATAVFGQTMYPGEVAWSFNGGENFSWIDETTGKQLRIDADGVCAKNLSIANFVRGQNGVEQITNKIDVKERLNAYQNSLDGIRSALNSSSTFEEFKSSALIAL